MYVCMYVDATIHIYKKIYIYMYICIVSMQKQLDISFEDMQALFGFLPNPQTRNPTAPQQDR